jgi:hypothetical protein
MACDRQHNRAAHVPAGQPVRKRARQCSANGSARGGSGEALRRADWASGEQLWRPPSAGCFVNTAADREVELTRIMDVTRHKDVRTVTGYVRRAILFGDCVRSSLRDWACLAGSIERR